MNDTRQIQRLILDGLCELKSWLAARDIYFYLRGGSVMGAVKYDGFVPWDDDADIAIERCDYDRLLTMLNDFNSTSENYVIYSYTNGDEIHCYFPQMFLKEEKRKALHLPKNNKLGLLLIDILPLDGAPGSTLARACYYFKVYLLRALAGAKTLCTEGNVTAHTIPVTIALYLLKWSGITKLYSQIDVYNKLDRLYRSQPESAEYKGTITAFHLAREVFPSTVWGQGTMHQFEDDWFIIPDKFDLYLKQLYGENYMDEEPSEAQKIFKRHVK